MTIPIDDRTEWLEADGLGGFASGTTGGIRTRRYHALLLRATTPPTGRMVLVNGFDAWADTSSGTFALTTQRYAPDVRHPDGASRIAGFVNEPWPTWRLVLPDGTAIEQEVLVQHGAGTTLVSWTVTGASAPVTVRARPLLSGRDYHSLHHENDAFRFDAGREGALVTWAPYDGVPAVVSSSNGDYRHDPLWYRQFLYADERDRGLDDVEDLASPGELSWTLQPGERAVWILETALDPPVAAPSPPAALARATDIRRLELARRTAFPTALDRAADAYLVRRGHGRTIVAGYPWFTDWGRDTFIAIRGLCLSSGRWDDARSILLEWAGTVSEGMLPNRFPDGGDAPEFNSVDASLWYVVAVHDLLRADTNQRLTCQHRDALHNAVRTIVEGYARGTRFRIHMDEDGLLAAGEPGVQLTWMDARVGDRVITPRIGKPVEIQALWLTALYVAADFDPRWREVLDHGLRSFGERFWLPELGRLADVVDVYHVPGTRDDTLRPNQIFAVGGLPLVLLDGKRARQVVDAIERTLLTPLGLRSLAPDAPGYAPRYEGDSAARDAVYHQGTVWPWLIGAFVEAWVRTRGGTAAAKRQARARFLDPLQTHLGAAGLGHVSEIADAEPPFTPRGCPFQAWSLGEMLRLDRSVLASAPRATRRRAMEHEWA